MTRPCSIALLVVAALATPAAGRAEVAAWSSGPGPRLERVDLETGQPVVIGDYGLADAGPGPLALDPSGTLYAIDPDQQRLLVVNRVTGAATVVGGLSVPLFQIFGFTADACGRLWMTGTPTSVPAAPFLYEVDPATGLATIVAPMSQAVYGLTSDGEELLGLIYDEQSRVVRIDRQSGLVSDVLPIDGLGSVYPFALDRAPNGDLWMYGFPLVPIDPLPNAIFRIEPDGTAGVTYFGFFYYPGLAIAPPSGLCGSGPPAPIPALSPAGLIALAAALAGAGLWMRRRSAEERSGARFLSG